MLESESLWPSTNAPLPPISDEDLEYMFYIDKMERDWKESLPNYSFRELMNIFPEAISAARRGLKADLKRYKNNLREVGIEQDKYYDEVIMKLNWQIRNDFKEDSDKDFDEQRKKINSKIKTTMFNLSYLDELEGKSAPQRMGGVSEADIARAKETPILNFVSGKVATHGKRAAIICPFHAEKQPSLTIYLDQNSWWCYSCNSGGTVIDFIMKQQNVDFLAAVKKLLV